MIPVPDYLKNYAFDISQKGSILSFNLKCSCGCEKFIVLNQTYTKEEIIQKEEYEKKVPNTGWHAIYGEQDSNGKFNQYIKVFGIFKKYIEFPDIPIFMNMKIMKVMNVKKNHN